MDAVTAFAAARRDRMKASDKDLAPEVAKALAGWTAEGEWFAELIQDASVLWLEFFEQEAPYADPDLFIDRFTEMLRTSLAKTSQPSTPPTKGEVDRVTYWLSTVTINNATYWGNHAHGGKGMRWVTMADSSVREMHRRVNGQIADRDGTFDVGGFDLRYPGEPVGPPEVWISCRCILAPARVEGALTMDEITAAAMTPEIEDVEDDLPVDELEDGEEQVTEIPVHGVAAVEGRATGDGRMFAKGSVDFGAMPQPLGFEFESSHGGDNSRVAVVGRIDEFFKVDGEEYTEIRFRGVIFPEKEYASQAIEGIVDGSYGGLSIIADSMALDVEATETGAMSANDGEMVTQIFSAARIRRFDMVPTPAYQEAYIALGPEFPDEMSPEALAACASCGEGEPVWQDESLGVDLTSLSEEELAAFDAMSVEEQSAYINDNGLIFVTSTYREVTPEERRKLADTGEAMPDGSFPITNVEDLRNAIQAIGRASDPEKARAHIKKRAKALGEEELIPEDWSLHPDDSLLASGDRAYFGSDLAYAPDDVKARIEAWEATVPEGYNFAPGTKDGRDGALVAWNARYQGAAALLKSEGGAASTTDAGTGTATSMRPLALSGESISLTSTLTTTSAGTGPDTLTDRATGASPSPESASAQLIESFMSAESDPSLMGLFSTTFAETVGASTPDISNLSLAQKTSLAAMLITAAVGDSADVDSMTSLTLRTGNRQGQGSALVASAETLSAAVSNGVKHSDVTALAARLVEAYSNPTTRDGPGWITHPVPTSRIRRYWTRGKGAAKIRWGVPGDFDRCRRQLRKYIANPSWLAGACANMHKEALGVWPGQEGGGRGRHSGSATRFSLAASASMIVKPAEAFENPNLSGPTPLTIDGDRIYGHLATWGVCHIGIQDSCVTAPTSSTNYAFYRTGVVQTEKGRVAVGPITMGTGHASLSKSLQAALAHYDNTATVVADVTMGEDSYGIWFSGLLRPDLTDAQVSALAAAALSGDWRRTAGGLELVAALAVNTPGYPIPRTSITASAEYGQEALVAAGIVQRESVTASATLTAEEIAGIARAAVEEYRSAQDRSVRMDALKPFIEKVRSEHSARVIGYFKED